jgi:RNA polymerase sigma-70 factor, ECF subfamily
MSTAAWDSDYPTTKASVNKLVERARADSTAFGVLLERFRQNALGCAFSITHDHEASLDVVQEAFTKAFKYLDSFSGEGHFVGWLHRIVTNTAIDYQLRVAGMHLDEPLPQAVLPSPVHELARQEARDKMTQALAKLTATQRVAFVMAAIDGLSYEKIARIMRCPKGTIMSRIWTARRRLHLLLKQDYSVLDLSLAE